MTPNKLIVPTLCVLLGCAGGATMGNVTAQTWPEPANVQRWQQECVETGGANGTSRRTASANEIVRERGGTRLRARRRDDERHALLQAPGSLSRRRAFELAMAGSSGNGRSRRESETRGLVT